MDTIQKLLLTTLVLFSNFAFGQWTQMNLDSLYYIENLSMLDDDLGYAKIQENFNGMRFLEKTTDGGVTWTGINLPNGGNEFQAMHFYADGQGVVVFRSVSSAPTPTRIFQTNDDGANWLDISPDTTATGIGIAQCQCLDQNTGFLATDNMFYATTDGGTSWFSKDVGASIISMDFYDAQHGTIGTFDGTFAYMGGVVATTDGGQTWNSLVLTDYQSVIGEVGQLSTTFSYAAPVKWGASNKLKYYTSTDNGSTWDTIFVPTNVPGAHLADIDFLDENNGAIVLTSNTANHIYHTHDGGATWLFQDSIAYFDPTDLVLTAGTGYLAGGLGTFFKLMGPLAIDSPKLNALTVYPNPIKNGESIQWKSTENINQFSLLDLSGKIVFQQAVQGTSVALPILPSGIYLAQLRGQAKLETIKVIIE